MADLKSFVKARTMESAKLIALAASIRASKFSRRTAASVKVVPLPWGAMITAGGNAAPMAYPFETGANHPLFGNKHHWYKQPKHEFLEEAADASATKAAAIMANVIDDWCDVLDL